MYILMYIVVTKFIIKIAFIARNGIKVYEWIYCSKITNKTAKGRVDGISPIWTNMSISFLSIIKALHLM